MREYKDFHQISLFTLMENQRLEYHSVIKFLASGGQSSSNIYKRMVVDYSDYAPSCAVAFQWARHLKDGQLNIEDNPRWGRPITTTDCQAVKVVEGLIIEVRRIKIQSIL